MTASLLWLAAGLVKLTTSFSFLTQTNSKMKWPRWWKAVEVSFKSETRIRGR